MRDSIDESISRDAVGLDDVMLKKMLLAYNTGKYSRKADIIIELTKAEADLLDKDETKPFATIRGRDLNQLKKNLIEKAGTFIEDSVANIGKFFGALFNGKNVFDSNLYQSELGAILEKENKYYLHSHGALKFVSDVRKADGTIVEKELVYYNEDVLEKFYIEEFQANRYGGSSDYAASVWEYLTTRCYTDAPNGISMYSHSTMAEEITEWSFESDEAKIDSFKDIFDLEDKVLSNVVINRQKISEAYLYRASEWEADAGRLFDLDTSLLRDTLNTGVSSLLGMEGVLDTAQRTYEMQEIKYDSLVSQYSTPIEFMIDLLNISSSKEFVNAFIDKMTKETEITLKLHKISKTVSEETTQVTKEKATVTAEAVVSAEVVGYDLAKDGFLGLTGYQSGNYGITVKSVTLEGGTWGFWNSINVNVKLSDIPSNINAFHLRITLKETGEYRDIVVGKSVWDGFAAFFSCNITSDVYIKNAWVMDRTKTREGIGTITEITTKVTNETKLDIAVKEAKTWYGTITYNNYVQENTLYESLDYNGNRVAVATAAPNMHTRTKETKVYTKNSSNANTTFATKKLINYVWKEFGSRVEKEFLDLKADNPAFWITGGHFVHSLATLYSDGGLQLYTDSDVDGELVNIRLTFAMENGPADWWINRYYLPIEIKCEALDYKKGTLYQTLDNVLVIGPAQVVENTDFFLSLLKNSTGKYDINASYDPNGEEVVYKTVYDSEDRVAKFFETSAEMLFELLESSPYTQGLTDVMRYTMYAYTTKDYGVTNFNYDTINREEFEYM